MTHNRQLEDVATLNSLWLEAATGTIFDGLRIEEQADYYGTVLAKGVVTGAITIENLRQLVRELNELDRQVVEKTHGDIESLAPLDYFEAIARRIGHQTARTALNIVKTKQNYDSYRRRYTPLPDIAATEAETAPG